jgi:release factor glutamine methyltransferase
MKETWTPLRLIQWAVPLLKRNLVHHSRLSAFSLVAFQLGVDTLKLHLHFERVLKESEVRGIKRLIYRRVKHEPLEYILGEIYFFGLPFKVTPAVLRPRLETGQLVEMALEALAPLPKEKRVVLDLGTGCGNIALAVAKYIPCRVWAVDISSQALRIAKANAHRLKVADALQWRQGDWFSALKGRDPSQFQVILCNPPYIAQSEEGFLNTEILGFEPPLALFGGKTGLDPYRAVARGLAQRLTPGGVGLMELDPGRAQKVSSFFKNQGLRRSFGQDDAGVNRVLVLEKKPG